MALLNFDRVVTNMMSRYGGTGTLIINTNSSDYDPTTGAFTPTVTNYPVKTLLMDYTMQKNGAGEFGGTLILVGDRQCYVQPINKVNSSLTMPEIKPNSDRIQIGNDIWKIVTLKVLNPSNASNNAVVFDLHLRK